MRDFVIAVAVAFVMWVAVIMMISSALSGAYSSGGLRQIVAEIWCGSKTCLDTHHD